MPETFNYVPYYFYLLLVRESVKLFKSLKIPFLTESVNSKHSILIMHQSWMVGIPCSSIKYLKLCVKPTRLNFCVLMASDFKQWIDLWYPMKALRGFFLLLWTFPSLILLPPAYKFFYVLIWSLYHIGLGCFGVLNEQDKIFWAQSLN